ANIAQKIKLQNIEDIATGASFSVALKENNIYVWGDNYLGPLGLDWLTKRLIPGKVDKLNHIKNPIKISCGGFHTLALTKQSKLYSWGYNQYGQLGSQQSENGVVHKIHLDNVTDISCGYYYSAAIC